MKSIITGFIAFLFFIQVSDAQYFEAGIGVGLSNYQGDISRPISKNFSWSPLNLGGSIFGRYNHNDQLSARLQFSRMALSGDDALSRDTERRRRNLSFRSPVTEVTLLIEANIPGYQPYGLSRPFSPFIFVGLGYAWFNPKSLYNDQWVELQPLGTEGQGLPQYSDRKPYKLTTLIIPIGAGVKYAFKDLFTIGLEIGGRVTFTDYIDDVSKSYPDQEVLGAARGPIAVALSNRTGNPVNEFSTRGNDKARDIYAFGQLTFSYNFLDNGLVGSRAKSSGGKGCYKF